MPADAPTSARSPRLARALLAATCGISLAGLAVTGGAPATTSAVQVSPAAVTTLVVPEAEEAAPHVPVLAAPRVTAPRATRSRALPAKPKPKKKVVTTDRWVRPSFAAVVSPFGMRWGRPHKGVDFGAHYGSPIRAIGDGVVVGTGYQSGESGYGQITIIRHANGYYSAYAHQSRMVVHTGDRVTAGEVIGYVGSTGHVTGPHLHFEIRTAPHGGQIDPLPWLRAHGVGV